MSHVLEVAAAKVRIHHSIFLAYFDLRRKMGDEGYDARCNRFDLGYGNENENENKRRGEYKGQRLCRSMMDVFADFDRTAAQRLGFRGDWRRASRLRRKGSKGLALKAPRVPRSLQNPIAQLHPITTTISPSFPFPCTLFSFLFLFTSKMSSSSSSSSSTGPSIPSAEEVKSEVVEASKQTLSSFRSLIAGGVGGVCAVVVGHPFDLVKVRMQTADKGVYSGALDVVRKTVAREGLRKVGYLQLRGREMGYSADGMKFKGLYAGVSAPLVGVTPMCEKSISNNTTSLLQD